MRQILLVTILAIITLVSPGQNKCGIYKACAYFTVTIPGMQMVDENGNKVPPVPNVQRFIYLECTGRKEPVIQSISYDNVLYHSVLSDVTGIVIPVGKRYDNEKAIVFKPKKGNRVWKLELQPVVDKPQSPEACRNISLKIKLNNATCSYIITGNETRLYTPPSY